MGLLNEQLTIMSVIGGMREGYRRRVGNHRHPELPGHGDADVRHPGGRAYIVHRLYLPAAWTDDCPAAGRLAGMGDDERAGTVFRCGD